MERIIVARTDPYGCPFDWVWMVRDPLGIVVAHGVEYDYSGGLKAVKRARAAWELRFDEPVPDFVVAQRPGDEAIGLTDKG